MCENQNNVGSTSNCQCAAWRSCRAWSLAQPATITNWFIIACSFNLSILVEIRRTSNNRGPLSATTLKNTQEHEMENTVFFALTVTCHNNDVSKKQTRSLADKYSLVAWSWRCQGNTCLTKESRRTTNRKCWSCLALFRLFAILTHGRS